MSSTNSQWYADANIYYSYDSARLYFEESVRHINDNLHMYMKGKDYEELSELPHLESLIHINRNSSRKNLIDAICEMGIDNGDYEFYEEYSRDELIQELYDEFSIERIKDFVGAIKDSNLKYKLNYTRLITKGYSQGDYAEVIILNEIYDDTFPQYIDNLFWDTPISGTIEFYANNTLEFFYVDEVSNLTYWNYPYDLDSFKSDLKTYLEKRYKYVAAKEKIIQICLDSLPTEITNDY